MRGVPETNLVRHLYKLFKQAHGESSDYELSRDVQEIDVFISHSWRAPWRFKILSIQWYLNQRLAVAISFAAVATGAIATLLLPWESVPHWHFTAIDGDQWEYGLTMYLGVIGFFAGLITGYRYINTPDVDKRCFFLDKCCIHQTDVVKQHDGIAGLGRLVLHSKRLAIFWDHTYFTRLWCVYELAIFLGSGNHTGIDVDFAPLFVPRAVLTIFFQGLLSYLALDVFSGLGIDAALRSRLPDYDPETAFLVFYILIHLLTTGALMQQLVQFQLDRAEMWRQLERFSVENARLTDEADRPRIYADIEKKWAGAGDNDGDALRNFEAYVRSDVARGVRAAVFGASGGSVPYSSLVPAFLPHVWRGIDTALGPEPLARRLHGLLFLTTLACLVYPLVFSVVPMRFAHWAAAAQRRGQPGMRRLLTLAGATATGMLIPIGAVVWAMLFFSGIPGASKAYDVGAPGSACLGLTVLAAALAVQRLYTGRTMDRAVFRRFGSMLSEIKSD